MGGSGRNGHAAFYFAARAFRRAAVAAGALGLVAGVSAPAWAAGTTERVSVSTAGVPGNAGAFEPAITPDGRFVAFLSLATNLVPDDTNGQQDVFVHDRRTGRTERVSVGTGGVQGNFLARTVAISANGRFV